MTIKSPSQSPRISVEMGKIKGKQKDNFLTAIWLLHGQLWAIIKWEASVTQC